MAFPMIPKTALWQLILGSVIFEPNSLALWKHIYKKHLDYSDLNFNQGKKKQ